VAAFVRIRWSLSIGLGGRFPSESVAALPRIPHTVERWRVWWRDGFPATPFWQVARAALMPPIDPGRLPASLLERFIDDDADRLIALLRFIGPVTGGWPHAR
jgi:hypothetical protein